MIWNQNKATIYYGQFWNIIVAESTHNIVCVICMLGHYYMGYIMIELTNQSVQSQPLYSKQEIVMLQNGI